MKYAGTGREVFQAFLILGLTSFGGPVAHLGYFRREFVEKRAWLSEADYAGVLSLCQFLPGPASSQAGFCIGLMRAGKRGGVAAWLGFTLPSAILMFGFAGCIGWFERTGWTQAMLHGLQLAAVAVVAQAVWVMGNSLCPDLPRRLLAVLALALVFLIPGTGGQIAVLLIGALVGAATLSPPKVAAKPAEAAAITRFAGMVCIALFFILLALSFLAGGRGGWGLAAAFYRTGALVFGGGHVVLPLLRTAIVLPGWVPPHLFLAGYGLAQAMPGPLFSVAAFLGAVAFQGAAWWGAALGLLGIFLPGLLLAAGALPFWHGLRQRAGLGAALLGVNAAVVGLLLYALLSLIVHGNVGGFWDIVIVLLALLALIRYKTPPIMVVAGCVLGALL